MQNPQTYLLGFFAWNHPQRSHPPFLECVLVKTLFSCCALKAGLFRAAYWGKTAMDFIYCLCGSYRNSEPDWNGASGKEEWKEITKGCWKSWAHCRAGSCSGLGRFAPVSLFQAQKINTEMPLNEHLLGFRDAATSASVMIIRNNWNLAEHWDKKPPDSDCCGLVGAVF